MPGPEGVFQLDFNPLDVAARRQASLLAVDLRTLLEIHDHPDSLEMEVLGNEADHRYFSEGGILAPKGFTPELRLTREGRWYHFHTLLAHPSRTTATTIGNEIDGICSPNARAEIISVKRHFSQKPDVNGVTLTRRPGRHELKASAAIIGAGLAIERLSREFTAVKWLY